MNFPQPWVETRLPSDYAYSTEGAAHKLSVSVDTIKRALSRSPKDRYFLKGHRDAPTGAWTIYAWDLEAYDQRRSNAFEREGD